MRKKITFKMFSIRGEGPLAEKYATGADLYLGTSIVGCCSWIPVIGEQNNESA